MFSSPASKYSIQGSKATDIEFYVSLALTKLHLDFKFQHPIGGGRGRRGGIVLDFLVFMPPLPTPLDLRGDYWHQPRQQIEDDLFLALAMSQGDYAPPVIIYGGELQTPEQAFSTVKRELRV